MESIRDLYNQGYLYLNLKFNKDISLQNDKIDNAVQIFFRDKGVPHVSNSERRAAKVEIIKTYKGLEDKENRLKKAIDISTQKLMLKEIPSIPIEFEKIEGYEEKKIAYLNEIKNSDLDSDKDFKKYLNDPNVQKLAASIEHNFAFHKILAFSNLSSGMTLNNFAHLMLSKYRPAILDIFPKGTQVSGNDFADIYLALLLLQKRDDFATAIIAVQKNLDNRDRNTRLFLGPLLAAVETPSIIIGTIQNIKVN